MNSRWTRWTPELCYVSVTAKPGKFLATFDKALQYGGKIK